MLDTIRVLHVDDSPGFGEMLATVLGNEVDGIAVETATSAREGRERLAASEVDCVVSDYDMPGTDGIEFLEAVREDHPDLPFVLFTGKGSEEVASEAISAGVSDYLQKGGGTEQFAVLANRIDNLVRQYRAERRVERHRRRQRESEAYLRELREIVCDPEPTPAEKRRRLLELGRERLDMDNGHLVRIDEESGRHQVVSTDGTDVVRKGVVDLSQTYCRRTISSDDVLDVSDAPAEGWADDPAYERFGLGAYIGRRLSCDGVLYGTLCYVSESAREEPFSPQEKAFFDLLCQRFSHLLERTRREERAEAVFQHAFDAIFLVDVDPAGDFSIRRVNRSYEELTGLSTADVEGRPPREILDGEDGGDVESRYVDCVERREPVEYVAALTIDGRRNRWRTRVAPVVENDEVVQLVGAARPIAGIEQFESAIAQ